MLERATLRLNAWLPEEVLCKLGKATVTGGFNGLVICGLKMLGTKLNNIVDEQYGISKKAANVGGKVVSWLKSRLDAPCLKSLAVGS